MKCECCGSSEWRPLFRENGFELGQCLVCDLLYVDDVPSSDQRMTEIELGHFAGTQVVLNADKQVAVERLRSSQFQAYIDVAQSYSPTGRWLDIGCGGGHLLSLANQAGYATEGIELNAARRAVAASVASGPVHGVPVEDLQFASESFDVISLVNVFSHLVSPTGTLTELRRLLKPTGVLIMATGEVSAGVEKSHVSRWNLGDHLYFLGDRTMARYAEKVGFHIVHQDRQWLPATLYTKEWLRSRGRSALNNGLKSGLIYVPGALALIRALMLRRQAGCAVHSSVFALMPASVSTSRAQDADIRV